MWPRRSSSKTYPSAPSTTPASSRSRIPRPVLTGMAGHKALRSEAGDILDRFAIEGQFRQRPADERCELVTGAAPAGTDRRIGKAGERSQDEVVICDQIIRALVRPLDIDDAGIHKLRHALGHKAPHARNPGHLSTHVRWIVVADLDSWRLPLEHRMAIDADVEIREDG